MRSTEEYLGQSCDLGNPPTMSLCPKSLAFRGRRQGRQPLNIYIYSILQYIIWWDITKQHGHLKKKKMIELNRPFSPSNNVRYNLRLQHGVNDMYIITPRCPTKSLPPIIQHYSIIILKWVEEKYNHTYSMFVMIFEHLNLATFFATPSHIFFGWHLNMR